MPTQRGSQGQRLGGWFDQHQRFLETSTTSATLARLNLRHAAMIDANADLLQGARVLDLASHDGRWTLAALEAGARHVTGIEARPELVAHAERTLAAYGAAPGSYEFRTGDVFEVLARADLEVDVVCCFGFLYHTLRFPEFFTLLAGLRAPWLLIDTKVHPGPGRLIRVGVDDVANEGQAAEDRYTSGTKTLVGSPSPGALRMMLRAYGYDRESAYDWSALVDRHGSTDIGEYADGGRVTWRCRWYGVGMAPRGRVTGE